MQCEPVVDGRQPIDVGMQAQRSARYVLWQSLL